MKIKLPQQGGKSRNPAKNEKGVALLTALFAIILIWYIVIEVIYDASIEFNVNSSRVSEVKAYYAAKSGMELGLLRVLMYRKVMSQFGDALKDNPQYAQMIEPLWQVPFAWPPVTPEDMVRVDKELIQDTVDESLMDAQYLVTIDDEGSKIDINDLASPSEALRDVARAQLQNIFDNQMKNDQDWAARYRGVDYQAILNNIEDWIDSDTQALQGGAEQAKYQRVDDEIMPPNRAFRSVEEVRMVAEMTPEIFRLLEPRITVFGMKAINPNYAKDEVLMSLSPEMTPDVVARIKERLNDPNQGPFGSEDDFKQFLLGFGVSLPENLGENQDQKIPLIFDRLYNFRITSIGTSAKSNHKITAVAYDLDHVAKELATLTKDPDPSPGPNPDPAPTTGEDDQTGNRNVQDPEQNKPPKGRPRLVYWREN